MRREVRRITVPHGFVMDIVEYDADKSMSFISLRFYYSQWKDFTDVEKVRCAEYMEKVRKVLRGYGVDSTLEPIYDLPTAPKGKFV